MFISSNNSNKFNEINFQMFNIYKFVLLHTYLSESSFGISNTCTWHKTFFKERENTYGDYCVRVYLALA